MLTNEFRTGTHTIAINDGTHPIAVYLSDAEATEVLDACRSKLTQIVLNKDKAGPNYDRDNRKPTDAFITDLKGLALLGSMLFGAVVPDRDDRAYLRAHLGRRAKIQVTRVTRHSLSLVPHLRHPPRGDSAVDAVSAAAGMGQRRRSAGAVSRRLPVPSPSIAETCCARTAFGGCGT